MAEVPGATEGPAELAAVRARRVLAEDALRLRGRSLISIDDLTPAELLLTLDLADDLREARAAGERVVDWHGARALMMVFEKPSLRTRVTFDLGMREMGGHAVFLGPTDIALGAREPVKDAARNFARWSSAIMARVFDHGTVVGLRDHSGIPTINGLSDHEHPCQALADLGALRLRKGPLEGLKLAWMGDGNNVLHSLMLAGAMVGLRVHAACPEGYEPDRAVVSRARELAGSVDAIMVTSDIREALAGADAVYTDVWASMGQESEAAARRLVFAPYQVNSAAMALARPGAVFMHCLPAHRGDEVTDDVLDSPASIVFDEAEYRLHAQKAVLALLLGP